jgi:hypothetical protein
MKMKALIKSLNIAGILIITGAIQLIVSIFTAKTLFPVYFAYIILLSMIALAGNIISKTSDKMWFTELKKENQELNTGIIFSCESIS